MTVSVASLLVALAFAVIFTFFVLLTENVFTVNVLLAWPALIVMLLTLGFATLSLQLDSVTAVLLGAGATNVTVPVTLLPPSDRAGTQADRPHTHDDSVVRAIGIV